MAATRLPFCAGEFVRGATFSDGCKLNVARMSNGTRNVPACPLRSLQFDRVVRMMEVVAADGSACARTLAVLSNANVQTVVAALWNTAVRNVPK